MTIQEELNRLEEQFKALFLEPPFFASELADFIETIVTIYKSNSDLTKEEMLKKSLETFDYFDEKYKIIESLDDWIKLPSLIEPFDSMILKLAIRSGIIPLAINNIMR